MYFVYSLTMFKYETLNKLSLCGFGQPGDTTPANEVKVAD